MTLYDSLAHLNEEELADATFDILTKIQHLSPVLQVSGIITIAVAMYKTLGIDIRDEVARLERIMVHSSYDTYKRKYAALVDYIENEIKNKIEV